MPLRRLERPLKSVRHGTANVAERRNGEYGGRVGTGIADARASLENAERLLAEQVELVASLPDGDARDEADNIRSILSDVVQDFERHFATVAGTVALLDPS
jgi:hypothetical protein